MKPRHVAALALIGWYLMVPPGYSRTPDEPDTEAPLRKWHIIRTFDSAADCEIAQAKLEKEWAKRNMTKPAVFLGFGDCIASGDPRLKGN